MNFSKNYNIIEGSIMSIEHHMYDNMPVNISTDPNLINEYILELKNLKLLIQESEKEIRNNYYNLHQILHKISNISYYNQQMDFLSNKKYLKNNLDLILNNHLDNNTTSKRIDRLICSLFYADLELYNLYKETCSPFPETNILKQYFSLIDSLK